MPEFNRRLGEGDRYRLGSCNRLLSDAHAEWLCEWNDEEACDEHDCMGERSIEHDPDCECELLCEWHDVSSVQWLGWRIVHEICWNYGLKQSVLCGSTEG